MHILLFKKIMNETSAGVMPKEINAVIRNQLLVEVCSSLEVKEKRKPVPRQDWPPLGV